MSQDWVRFAGGEGAQPVTGGSRFVVGVIANLSACTGCERWKERLASRFVDVDRDNFENLLARVAPHLDLGLPGCEPFSITSFEHFHPDGLAQRIPSLARLLEARESVNDPSRVRRLLEAAGAPLELDESPAPNRGEPPAPAPELGGGDLLESLLDARTTDAARPPTRSSVDPAFDRLIREIADASADRTDVARLERWRAAIDTELARRVRAVLRHPRFQALEASWRGLRDLVFNSESGAGIRLRVLDIAREDLRTELNAGLALEATVLHRLVVEEERGTPGGEPFSLLLADFEFEATDVDTRLLAHLARIAAIAHVPLVTAAGRSIWEPVLRGEPAGGAAWLELRDSADARWIALACPRLLARLPYGRATEPCDRFAFEEEATSDNPERYLWSNPGFLVARAALDCVAATGSAKDMARFGRFESLPFHAHVLHGETVGFGPTEKIWTDREIERLRAASLTAILSARGGDFGHVTSPTSIAGSSLPFQA